MDVAVRSIEQKYPPITWRSRMAAKQPGNKKLNKTSNQIHYKKLSDVECIQGIFLSERWPFHGINRRHIPTLTAGRCYSLCTKQVYGSAASPIKKHAHYERAMVGGCKATKEKLFSCTGKNPSERSRDNKRGGAGYKRGCFLRWRALCCDRFQRRFPLNCVRMWAQKQ